MRSRLSIILPFTLFISLLLITGCQKDDLVNPDGQVMYRDASSFTYSINPAQVGDSVTISYDALNSADCGHVQIQVSGPNGQGWQNGGKPIEPDSGVATLLFIPQEPGEYQVRAKYTRTGKKSECDLESSGWFVSTELLIVEADSTGGDTTTMDSSCVASFTVDSVTCDSSTRTIVLTLVSDTAQDYIKIKGNLNKGLDDDAIITVAGADFDIGQKKPGNSTGRIITLEGSVEACVPVTITITFNSTYNGPYLTSAWTAHGNGLNLEIEPVSCE